MLTEKDINEAIETCYWRELVCDVFVCKGILMPCSKAVEEGKCETLIELFEKEKGGE